MSNKFWIGLVFIVFGLGFLLQQAKIWDFSLVLSMWWPLILIIIGVIQLANRSISAFSGIVFIAVGGLFLVNQWVDRNIISLIWPILLIIVGLTFIFSKRRQHKRIHSAGEVQIFSLFSGSDFRSDSKDFEGGDVTAVFGGAELDLRDVVISENSASLEVTTVFGGITVYIPEHVRVEVTGIPIFGGWEDKTRKRKNIDETQQVLKMHCLAAFGGVEIYN